MSDILKDPFKCAGCGKECKHPPAIRTLWYRDREWRPGRFGRMEYKAVNKQRNVLYCSTSCANEHHSKLQMAHEG